MKTLSEPDFGNLILNILHRNNIETWQEVNIKKHNNSAIDIVAKYNDQFIGIELKTTLNEKVLQQANRNNKFCNYSFVIVPKRSSTYKNGTKTISGIKQYYINGKNLKVVLVPIQTILNPKYKDYYNFNNNNFFNILLENPNKIKETTKAHIKNFLFEDQKQGRSGVSAKEMITPFKRSCNIILKYLQINNEIITKKQLWEILKEQLHWKSYNSFNASLKNNETIYLIPDILKELKI